MHKLNIQSKYPTAAKTPCRLLLSMMLALASLCTQAADIDFGKITSTEDGFQKYWGLSKEEAKAYHNYMEIVGKYRHKDTPPLVVMSMIAETQEDKLYYARKAAEHEHEMVKRELEAAMMWSDALNEGGENSYASKMQAFTDEKLGLNTRDYIPLHMLTDEDRQWQEGDKLVILVDERCLTAQCLQQFVPVLQSVPEIITQRLLLIQSDTFPEENAFDDVMAAYPGLQLGKFDPIEHKYLGPSLANRPVHVRNNQLINLLPQGSFSVPTSGSEAKIDRAPSDEASDKPAVPADKSAKADSTDTVYPSNPPSSASNGAQGDKS